MNEQKAEKRQSRKPFRHLRERERYQLEYMLKKKMKISEIAKELGFARSTIYAEVKRGKVKQIDTLLVEKEVYLADYAQRDYDRKKHEKGRWLKVGNDMEFVRYVEHMILDKRYSPMAVLMSMESGKFRTKVCQRTLYNYIHDGIFLNVTEKDLPYKIRKKKEERKSTVAKKNVKGKSIELRPASIRERKEYGHWEMDTVYSGRNKSKSCLLVLTERKTRMEEIYLMKDRTQSSVIHVLDGIEKCIGVRRFSEKYRTITMDNGMEFLDYESIERSVRNPARTRTQAYYCHPFCSSERGSNENQNKLIRRWIPKGEDISRYKQEIPFIQSWINNYPRKLFGGKSSVEIYLSLTC